METTEHNAHKIVYLIEQYPDKTIGDIIKLFQLPGLDINAAIWLATDNGLLKELDEKTGIVASTHFLELKDFDFGPKLEQLMDELTFCFTKQGEKESDVEENYLSAWMVGYPSQDQFIAVKYLIDRGILAEYMIESGEEGNYTFYTLSQNKEHLWGRKQFKKDPLALDVE